MRIFIATTHKIRRAAPLEYGNAHDGTLLWFTGVASQMIYCTYGRTLIELICGLVFSRHSHGLRAFPADGMAAISADQ